MRLDEITKEEFLDQLKDPAIAKIKGLFSELEDALEKIGYKAELFDNRDGTMKIHIYRYKDHTTVSIADRIIRHYFRLSRPAADYNMNLVSINKTKGVESTWLLTWGETSK